MKKNEMRQGEESRREHFLTQAAHGWGKRERERGSACIPQVHNDSSDYTMNNEGDDEGTKIHKCSALVVEDLRERTRIIRRE